MAVRIREGGSPIVCAAMHPELPGDTYIDDGLHYRLSVEYGVLVSEPMEKHEKDGLWWWFNEVPVGRTPEPRYEQARVLMRGRVVHCKRDAYDVYIGRPSKWGNPFPLPKGYDIHVDPDRILERYEAHVRSRPDLMAGLPELRGKVLACWCAPKPCHGDVLLRMANDINNGATSRRICS